MASSLTSMKNLIMRMTVVMFLVTSSVLVLYGQELPTAKPGEVQMSSQKLNQIDGLVEKAIAEKKMPGAVVLVGRRGKIVFKRAYGNRALVPKVEKMTTDTIFDLASLTKPVATATSIMILIEQGKLRLSDTVGKFIPDIDDPEAKKVTIKQLLTHTSGYRPDFNLGEKWDGREGMLAALKKERLRNPRGAKFVYSDIGFIVLGEIVARITRTLLNEFIKVNLDKSLGLKDTFFNQRGIVRFANKISIPGIDRTIHLKKNVFQRIAPTESFCGQQSYLGSKPPAKCDASKILKGFVHDPTSYRINGIAGHAGLFSTADDLARYCQMLLTGGTFDGKRLLSATTVAKMTKPYVISEKGDARGLGWDINTRFSSNRGELFPLGSFGHTGFTGTGIWIDPLSETFVIFLSNRVHPDGKGSIVDVRARISTVVASAIKDITPKQIRDFEAQYNSAVAEDLTRWNDAARRRALIQLPFASRRSLKNLQAGVFRKTQVLNGIDVLEKQKFASLKGLRIGLVTNHTGRSLSGNSSIDILNEAENVKLVSLFSPEHGIRGELDQSKINDSVDEKTGLPIYSLYGKSRRPKPEQLANLDALVFDIQDIGTRFYTYISTLRFVLEEAAKADKKVFVLDRPNPINGIDVAGAVADEDKLSFVATHTLPVRHGMTIGEIALMMNKERKINARLEIVKMENWRRSMWFDETGQTWINPSPNMRNLTQATLYPGIGLLETTNLSVGRGTDTPFEVIGAPWIDGRKLAAYLNERKLQGVRFVPVKFTPSSSVFKGEVCEGVNIVVVDRSLFETLVTGVETALALRKLFPGSWEMARYNRLLVSSKTFENIRLGKPYKTISRDWQPSLAAFNVRKKRFFLYK